MVKLTESMVLKKTKSSSLRKVRRLNFWSCDLTDISILHNLPNLTIASLSTNQISSLADLANSTNLEELYLRRNAIQSLTELVHLKNLPKLRVLWLEGSPCSELPEYRQTVLHVLPQLQRLDKLAVEDNEVELAAQLVLDPSLFAERVACQKTEDLEAPYSEQLTNKCSAFEEALVTSSPSLVSADVAAVEETPSLASSVKSHRNVEESLSTIRKGSPSRELDIPSTPAARSETSIANVLQAVLCLLAELDHDDLNIVSHAVRGRLTQPQ